MKMENKFEWTDDLAKEFSEFCRLHDRLPIEEIIKIDLLSKFKASKAPAPECEVIGYSNGIPTGLKRLSDGKEFFVGDTVVTQNNIVFKIKHSFFQHKTLGLWHFNCYAIDMSSQVCRVGSIKYVF